MANAARYGNSMYSVRQAARVALVCSLLVSCSNDGDEVLRVTCDDAADKLIPVQTVLGSRATRVSRVGYINSENWALGTVIELRDTGAYGERTLAVTIYSPVSTANSAQGPTLVSAIVHASLQVRADPGLNALADHQHVDLTREVIDGTELWIWNPESHFISDFDRFVALHPEVEKALRDNRGSSYAVVSGVVSGDDIIAAKTSDMSLGVGVFLLGSDYVHVSYSCSPIESLQRDARRADGLIPMVIYLNPVTYDHLTGHYAMDGRPMNLNNVFVER